MRMLERLIALALLVFACSPTPAQVATDESAIRELAARWEQAWNSHDMKRLASLMSDDADFVNVGARHWVGREQIEAEHTSRLAQFRDSIWSTSAVRIQFLEPAVALAHVDWTLQGDRDPDGTPRSPRSGVFTWVVVKQSDEWLIRAAQNTNQGPYAAQRTTAHLASAHDQGPESLVDAFVQAWNSHDIEAFATLFAPDATWVTTFDTRDEGREAIVADLRAAHEIWAKNSAVAASKTAIKLLRPDVATVQFNLMMTVAGSAEPVGRTLLLVASRHDHRWKISAGQITKPNCP